MAKSSSKDRPQGPFQAEQPLRESRVKTTQIIHSEAGKSFEWYKSREHLPSSPAREHFPRKRRNGTTKPIYDMKYHPMDEVLRPNAPTTAKARSQRLALFCDPSDLTPPKDNRQDGLGSCRKRKRARPLRTSSPTLKMRADAQAERKLGSDTTSCVTEVGTQLNAAEKDPFSVMQSSMVRKCSNHTPSPEIDTGHPFKMPNPSDWDGMEGFNRRLYLLQQGAPLGGNTLPVSWHQAASILIMEGFFTEKQFENFGGVAALISWYETVHREVEAFFRSIPELVDKRDCLTKLAEDEKVSKLSSGVGYRQHWECRSATPSSVELAQLKPPEVAIRGGIGANEAMHEATYLSPNTVISSINLDAPFGSAYYGQTQDYHGHPDQFSGGSLCKGDVDEIEGLMSEEAFALLLPEPGRSNAENTVENPLIDLTVTNTQFQPDVHFKQHPPNEVTSNQNTGDPDPMAALFRSCKLKSNIIKTHAKTKPSTVHFQVFEDGPEGTPPIRNLVPINPPPSPGTDDKKENIEDHDIKVPLNIISQVQDRSASSMLYPQLAASFNGWI